ncbi:hypothetical protein M446_3970 [Methylobacterium sp. 4-46]|uniref:hypothetical protein n=1 Tax=unclassified Methylobacterium TaxID=2615210 RepID=UPI000165C6B9|nr:MULTISPECIES: hypothetical protein [Methylobacterium]ACA18336.1 hypothetical protein M446_3970 [Methylobacterium sp. 4-46]WFT77632.1 hypothetical protein QA634_20165 [Methylobacterium nodulans]
MKSDICTISDLYEFKRVTDEQLDAAVTNFLNDPKPGARPLAEGIAIDVCAVIAANPHAREVLAARASSEAEMRMAVRTAIMLARPARYTDAIAAQEVGTTSPAAARRKLRFDRQGRPKDPATDDH